MRYVRPFDPDLLAAGEASAWLLAPDEDAGCTIRVCKGGGTKSGSIAEPFERFALILAGEATLRSAAGTTTARQDDLIFVPAHQSASVSGTASTAWIEICATVDGSSATTKGACRVVKVDESKFSVIGGLAYLSLIDRDCGSGSLRMNFAKLQPDGASPDFHIHQFNQIYLILEGEETVDIGRKRFRPSGYSLVYLPAGIVHRQFNASKKPVKLATLLVPEPQRGEIFDFAVTIHDREGEVMTQAQAQAAAQA